MERLARAMENPERRVQLLKWMYLISTGFMLFGFAVMFYLVFVHR